MEEEASDGGLCPLLSFIGGEFYLYHPNYTSTVPQWPRADSAAINTDGKGLDDLCKIISYISNLRLSAWIKVQKYQNIAKVPKVKVLKNSEWHISVVY